VKVALLDRRFGKHGGHKPEDYWRERQGVEWRNPDQCGQGNTFAFIDAFGEVMTGPLEVGVDYSLLKDYDLLYLRMRDGNCGLATKRLRETCSKPVIIGYTDELVNSGINDLHPHKGWIYEVSKHIDVMISSFPEKYERPKHEKLGITNWEYCPYGSDVFHWKQWYNEDKANVVAGMWHMRSFMRGGMGDRIHSQTFSIMRKLQKYYDVECVFFLNFDGWKLEPQIREHVDSIGLDVKLVRHVQNNVFNEMLSKCKVFMEEYQCPNYSRATVVSAGVGTPQVGTDMNTPSNVLFPFTTTEHGNWEEFLSKAEQLLGDEKFYRTVQTKALNMTNQFYYPMLKKRILELYERYRHE